MVISLYPKAGGLIALIIVFTATAKCSCRLTSVVMGNPLKIHSIVTPKCYLSLFSLTVSKIMMTIISLAFIFTLVALYISSNATSLSCAS